MPDAPVPAPRPLVMGIEWRQDSVPCREIYGPWAPAEDDSHIEAVTRFLKGWRDRTGITTATPVLWLCTDPEEWLAGKAESAAACPDPDNLPPPALSATPEGGPRF